MTAPPGPRASPIAHHPAFRAGRPHRLADGSSAAPRPAPDTVERGGGQVALAGRRVLLAEDELLLALDVQMMLEDEGMEVIGPVSTLDEAMAAVAGESAIDAAILDVDLRGEDVFPLAEHLTERDVPFLFHTGQGSREGVMARFADAPLCAKPVLARQLVAMVRRLLA